MYTDRAYEEITLNGMRKIIASRLTEAKQTIPHFYLRRSIALDALLKTRGEINSGLADSGVKISVNDFIIKASAKALQDVPGCNAVWAGDRLLQMKASDVAVAVAIDGGLFTPVIQDAELKPLSVISTEMKDLATRAKERKLAPRGLRRRQLHHLQPRHVRRGLLRRDPAPGPGCDPRGGCLQAHRRARQRHGRGYENVSHTVCGSPCHRRRARCAIPKCAGWLHRKTNVDAGVN